MQKSKLEKFFSCPSAIMIKRSEVDSFMQAYGSCDVQPGTERHASASTIRWSKQKIKSSIAQYSGWRHSEMCRNIRPLFNFEPPVTEEEIRAASLQFVRKISGFNTPSKTNEAAFLAAVDEIAAVSSNLLSSLKTIAPPRNRTKEAAKAQGRAAQRFSK